MKRAVVLLVSLAALVALAAPYLHAQIPTNEQTREALKESFKKRSYSPYAGLSFPTRPLWGDTHLHTGLSMDAGAFGNRLGLDEAYRFAKGEEIVASGGQRVRLSRPLDWLAVTDHSDNMGLFPDLFAGKPHILADPKGREWYERIQAGEGVDVALELIGLFSQGNFPEGLMYWPDEAPYKAVWKETVESADEHNMPGEFTAFVGYEWTSLVQGNNMHRVVILKDGADKALQVVPFTATPPAGDTNPRRLWMWLGNYEEKTGGDVLAIAHNGNLANGIMFPLSEQYDGKRLDKEYVQTRAKWEPLYEITQIKGDGETHPFLSPEDEFADYENWDIGNLDVSQAKTNDMLAGEYAREALKRGLVIEDKLGTNPYKVGFIGSTDSHTSLVTAQEDNFFGKHSGAEPNPERMGHPFMKTDAGSIMGWQQVSSGLAAVWAPENTREAIFEAMERKEVYGTTGSRMFVRFFGGWEFTDADWQSRTPAVSGYTKGVPMGGDLPAYSGSGAPSFLVYALKDPIGGNLDRIQIVKGWQDSRGATHEKVYDVVWAGERRSRRRRQAAGNRQHCRCEAGDVHEHDRRCGARHRLDGPGLRRRAECRVLRARHRDPDASLEHLRRRALRHPDPRRRPGIDAGAGLHEPDLVLAGRLRPGDMEGPAPSSDGRGAFLLRGTRPRAGMPPGPPFV